MLLPVCILCGHALTLSSSGCPTEYRRSFPLQWRGGPRRQACAGLSTGAHRWPLQCEGLRIVGLMWVCRGIMGSEVPVSEILAQKRAWHHDLCIRQSSLQACPG